MINNSNKSFETPIAAQLVVRREQKKETVPADYGGKFRDHYILNYWYRRDKSILD
jgi:hypothetical protein